jgi:hypothetical protein
MNYPQRSITNCPFVTNPTMVIFTPYKQEINLSTKGDVRLFKKELNSSQSSSLVKPGTSGMLFINNVASCTAESKWGDSILKFTINGETLNLIKVYRRIQMSVVDYSSR